MGARMTADEIVSALSHSEIPTLVVEGKDDMELFRSLESLSDVNIVPCGGKETLLKVYERRAAFSDLPCTFLVDRDLGVFEEEKSLDGLVVTKGFSIENDFLYGVDVSSFYAEGDRSYVLLFKEKLAEWWSFEVRSSREGKPTNFSRSLSSIFGEIGDSLDSARVDIAYYEEKDISYTPDESLKEEIMRDFELKMRGHQLLEMHKFLLKRNKNENVKRLAGALMPACIFGKCPPLVVRLIEEIRLHVFPPKR